MRAAIINRYILSEILPGFLINILVFTAVMLMARTMRLANLVVAKGVGPGQVLEIFFLAAPRILSLTLPMATLLAVLTAFMRLSADSELTVLRASGVSLYQLSPPVFLFGGVTALLTAVFSLWLAPQASWLFKLRLLDLAKARADLAIVDQTFIRSFPGLVLYIGQMDPAGGGLGQIFINDGRRKDENAVIVARRGRLGLDREGGVLVLRLEEGVIDRVRRAQGTDSIFFTTYELKISPGEDVADQNEGGLFRGRAEMPTSRLGEAAAGLGEAARRSYRLEWHERWSRPVAAFIMTLIGLPLGASFRARGRNFALLTALLVFVVYYAISSLGWSMSEMRGLPPVVGIWTANVLLAALGVALLRRINRGAPIDPAEFMRRLTARLRPAAREAR